MICVPTADGQVINTNNLWVTTVDEEGHVGRQDWTEHYEKLRRSLGAARPVSECVMESWGA